MTVIIKQSIDELIKEAKKLTFQEESPNDDIFEQLAEIDDVNFTYETGYKDGFIIAIRKALSVFEGI